MPVGGVTDQILVEEGDAVKAGQVLMKLDTEASEERRLSLEKAIKLKQEQLALKDQEKRNAASGQTEQLQMLENNLQLQIEILERYQKLEDEGAASELQFLGQRNIVEETRGRLMAEQGRSAAPRGSARSAGGPTEVGTCRSS